MKDKKLTTQLFLLQLDENSFSGLKVKEHHYDEVNNLTLDSNLLQSLPEKLLDMKLKVAFSARNNNLTSVRKNNIDLTYIPFGAPFSYFVDSVRFLPKAHPNYERHPTFQQPLEMCLQ